jgi:beta-lactamase regulating signal transducer with metallopeptidase domain/protein involved in polysaccharide export with SLBB domain/phage shock protein A
MPDSMLIQHAAQTLMHFAWQGLAIAILCWALMTLFRRPSVRYAIGCVGLLAMLVAPIVTFMIFTRASVQTITFAGPAVASVAIPISQIDFTQPSQTSVVAAAPPVPWRDQLAFAAVTFWFVGVAIFALRHVFGLAGVARLRRRATRVVDAVLLDRFAHIAAALNLRRPIALLSTIDLDAPAVVGWLRPAILWPASLMTGLTPSQLDGLLAHELAHIRRHDYLVNLLQTLIETLGFYHPAVWWLSRRVRQEREHCCDDIAAEIFGDRHGYAEVLVSLETSRGHWLPGVVASNGGSLMTRVQRLVSPARSSNVLRPFPSPLFVMAILCAITTCASFAYRTARATTVQPTTAPAKVATDDDQVRSLAKRDLVMAGLVFRRDRLDAWIAEAKDHSQSPKQFDGLKRDREVIAMMITARLAELANEPEDELRSPTDATYVELWNYLANTRATIADNLQSLPADASERLVLESKLRRADEALRRSEERGGYYIGGNIERAGAYDLPPDGITLKPAIDAAGNLTNATATNPGDAWIAVTLPCQSDRTKESRVFVRYADLDKQADRALYLLPGDNIQVGARVPPEIRMANKVVRALPANNAPLQLPRQIKAVGAPANIPFASKIAQPDAGDAAAAADKRRSNEFKAEPDAKPFPDPLAATQPTTSPTAAADAQRTTAVRAAKIEALTRQIDELRRQLDSLNGDMPPNAAADLALKTEGLSKRILTERNNLEAALSKMQTEFGPDAPQVVDVRQRLRAIEQKIEATAEDMATNLAEKMSVEHQQQLQSPTADRPKPNSREALIANEPFFARLIEERDALKFNLAQLRSVQGENSPPVVRTRESLRALDRKIDDIAKQLTKSGAGAPRTGPYYVSGAVTRPGVFNLGADRVSVLQALIAAGHNSPSSVGVHITRRWPDDSKEEKLAIEVNLTYGKGNDITVRPGDTIVVGPMTEDIKPTTMPTTAPEK